MVTQKQIARRLRVSPSLVSRALSGSGAAIRASPRTLERIRKEAARLNYHPNPAALALRGTKTKIIGVVIRNFDDPFFGHIIGELQNLVSKDQYSLLLTGSLPGLEPAASLKTMLKYSLDGVVIAGSDFVPEGLDAVVERRIPIVRIGVGKRKAGVIQISVDEEDGARQIVRYLRELGHWDIGYIGDTTLFNLRRERLLLQAMKRERLSVRTNTIVRMPNQGFETGYLAMQRLIKSCGDGLPTAIVAAQDTLAQSGLRAMSEHHLRVPQDISLIGIDDIPWAKMMIPALTTLRQPVEAMVKRAFDVVARNRSAALSNCKVRPKLVIRESSAPPRQRGSSTP